MTAPLDAFITELRSDPDWSGVADGMAWHIRGIERAAIDNPNALDALKGLGRIASQSQRSVEERLGDMTDLYLARRGNEVVA
jgi:hypothetical protein